MQQPSRRLDKQFDRILQRLPGCWQTMMVTLKAFAYGNKIKDPQDLLRVILLYCGLDLSLREVAGVLTLTDEEISDEAVRKRLNRCGDFLEAVVKEFLHLKELPRLPSGRRIVLVDGTVVLGPGATGTDYRIHLCIDLLTLHFVDMQVSDDKKGESLKNFAVLENDIFIGDRAYCSVSAILDTKHKHKADLVVRWKLRSNLYDSETKENSIDLKDKLKDLEPDESIAFPVVVGYSPQSKCKDDRTVRGTIHAYRMTEKQAKLAKRNAASSCSKKQKKLSVDSLYFSQFVIVFSSLPLDVLSTEDALALYRVRWQVELAIKRLKSVLDIDKLRAKKGSKLSKVYLYGKLLYVLLVDEQLQSYFGQDWRCLDAEREGTAWRPTKLIKRALDAAVLQVQRWRPEALDACRRVLMERPRNRKLQTIPQRVLKMNNILEQLNAA